MAEIGSTFFYIITEMKSQSMGIYKNNPK